MFQSLAAGQSATDSFGYTVADFAGATDTATVRVTVTGLNDAPTVDDQSFNVDENSPDDTAVGTVAAFDVDAGDELSFAINGGSSATAFDIDENTGEITVADSAQLDFETTPSFTLGRHRHRRRRPHGHGDDHRRSQRPRREPAAGGTGRRRAAAAGRPPAPPRSTATTDSSSRVRQITTIPAPP